MDSTKNKPYLLKKRDKPYSCSVEATLDIIGGKWKSLILFRLSEVPVLRFSELRKTIPNITEKMLTAQLRELESDGLVRRKIYPVIPPKTEYSLTPLGITLRPILEDMKTWGDSYLKNTL